MVAKQARRKCRSRGGIHSPTLPHTCNPPRLFLREASPTNPHIPTHRWGRRIGVWRVGLTRVLTSQHAAVAVYQTVNQSSSQYFLYISAEPRYSLHFGESMFFARFWWADRLSRWNRVLVRAGCFYTDLVVHHLWSILERVSCRVGLFSRLDCTYATVLPPAPDKTSHLPLPVRSN